MNQSFFPFSSSPNSGRARTIDQHAETVGSTINVSGLDFIELVGTSDYSINLHGFTGGVDRQMLYLYVSFSSYKVYLTIGSGSAPAGTQLILGAGITPPNTVTLVPGTGYVFIFSYSDNRWILLQSPPLAIGAVNSPIAMVTASETGVVGLSANQFFAQASAGGIAAKTITDFALSLLSQASAASGRSTLNIEQGATQAVSGGTTTLSESSAPTQEFTGSGAQTVTMPVVSTLALGRVFCIINNASSFVSLQSSGLDPIGIIPKNWVGILHCVLTSGTTSASWDLILIPSPTEFYSATGSGNFVKQQLPNFDTGIGVGLFSTTNGFVVLYGLSSGAVTVTVPDAAGTHTIKLPTTTGAKNQVLKTDGAGQWGWANQDFLTHQIFN